MRARSITLRLTLLFSIASAAVLLLVGALIGRQVEDHFEELDLEILQGKLDLVRHSLALGHAPHEQLAARIASLTAGADRPVIAVAAPDGRVLFASPGVVFPPVLLGQQNLAGAADRGRSTSWEHAGRHYRGIAAQIGNDEGKSTPVTVAVAIDIESHNAFVSLFRKSLAPSVLAGIGLTAVLGWFAARGGLTPVREIARNGAGHLGQPPRRPSRARIGPARIDRTGHGLQRHADAARGLVPTVV